MAVFVLEHQACRHFVSVANNREQVESTRRMLAAAGYFQFRVRRVTDAEVDSVVAAVSTDAHCVMCRVDPERGRLPGVWDAKVADADAAGIVVTVAPTAAGVEIMPGACVDLPDEIAAMRKQTHDGLLDVVAGRRCSPVSWQHWHGLDACWSTLSTLYADDHRPVKAHGLDQFEAFFREHPTDCVLIVASCDVTGPAA